MPLPGSCFRLIERLTAHAQPDHCPAPVRWRGTFTDRAGRRHQLDACDDHASDLESCSPRLPSVLTGRDHALVDQTPMALITSASITSAVSHVRSRTGSTCWSSSASRSAMTAASDGSLSLSFGRQWLVWEPRPQWGRVWFPVRQAGWFRMVPAFGPRPLENGICRLQPSVGSTGAPRQ
jgi:hypothetical protein